MLKTLSRLLPYLEERGVRFEHLPHRSDFTAQETAADTHTPGLEFAKVVIVRIRDGYAMLVLPAHRRLDLTKLRTRLANSDIRLANEEEMRTLFPDCEVGAEPPFGHLYGLPVFVSPEMNDDTHITFNAGSHDEAYRMDYRDYLNLENPRTLDFSD